MIHIIKYDPYKISVESIKNSYDILRQYLPENDELFCVPYGMDILMDVPIEAIIKLRNDLNEIINARTY